VGPFIIIEWHQITGSRVDLPLCARCLRTLRKKTEKQALSILVQTGINVR
jgi:ribosomal protein L28